MGVDLTLALPGAGRVTDAFEAKKLLEVSGFRNQRFRGYSSTETTNLNNFIGEEPAFRGRRELGQIGIFNSTFHFMAA